MHVFVQQWRDGLKMLIQWMKTGMMDKWEERPIRDRQLERIDGLMMQREIVKGLMVMDGRAQSHRQIIRQAANAELLAVDHNQTRACIYLSRLSGEADAELSVIHTVQFDRLSYTCCLLLFELVCVFLSNSHCICVVNS